MLRTLTHQTAKGMEGRGGRHTLGGTPSSGPQSTRPTEPAQLRLIDTGLSPPQSHSHQPHLTDDRPTDPGCTPPVLLAANSTSPLQAAT